MSAEGSRLKQILSRVPLAPEQQQLVDLFLSLDEEESGSSVGHSEPGSATAPPDEEDERELAALRRVNDTVAAALGACQLCWGGDRECPVCAGRGRAGFAEPDLELFRNLVVPAVRRVRTLAAAGGRTGNGRTVFDSPQEQR